MSYSRAFQEIYNRFENDMTNWLYGDWNEEKYRYFQMAYAIPGIHSYMDYLLDRRSDEEYLRRYGMDYTNIHDPRKLRQTSSASRVIGSSYRLISRNIDDLYSDYHNKKRKKK